MKLVNGYVLVAPQMRNDKILLSNGKELLIDTSFARGEHAEIVCDVMAIPVEKVKRMEKLAFDWECDIDIKVGDEVYCDYRFVNLEMDDSKTQNVFYINGRRCIIIHYKHIFVAKRNKKTEKFVFKDGGKAFELITEIIMLNGYILLEPYKNKNIQFTETEKQLYSFEQKGGKVPDFVWDRMPCRMGIVRYIGKPNKRYMTQKSKWSDSFDIKVGDTVVFLPERDIFLEYSLHAKLEGKKQFFRVQNHDIIAKIEF
jgi:hypothetical protein